MTSTSGPLYRVLGWLVTLTVPVAIVLTIVRLMLTPTFVGLEYRMPGFPEDPFGFTLDERVKWANVSLDYLLNDEKIDFFNDKVFSDGAPLYEDRELRHMDDVKVIVSGALLLWYFSLAFLVTVGFLSSWGRFTELFRRSLRRGAFVTLGFVGAVVLFVIAAFNNFFVLFHEILFEPGTWTFSYADTFIRLFPQRFWQDAFLWIGGLAIAVSLWVSSMTKPKSN